MEIKLISASFQFRKRLLMIIMRTFIFLCCTAIFALKPYNVVSQNSKIKIETNKTLSVDEIFDLIMDQTDYKFFYEEGIFKGFPKVKVKRGVIRTNKLLKQSLSQGNLNITVTGNNAILIKEKPIIDVKTPQQKISGVVTDKSGVPLPGASVIEKGTTNGSTTDFDGNFTLFVDNGNAILVVSYLGYLTKEIIVNNENNFTIQLEASSTSLDEVVLIGYGQQTSKTVTSSIARVDVDEASKFSTANASQILQGRVTGVNITSADESVGAETTFTIRGVGSFTNTAPLFVIDGTFTDNMDFLNPRDIESIQVLKDASASAIYGSRAANGVIIITTKKGFSGEPRFEAGVSYGVQNAAKKYDFVSAREYADIVNGLVDENGGSRSPANDSAFNPNVNTNWQSLQAESNAPIANYYIGYSGGDSNLTYSFSGNYFDQKGIVIDSEYERLNLRANSTFRKGKFTLNNSIIYTREVTDRNRNYSAGYLPTLNPFNPDNPEGYGGIEASFHGLPGGTNTYALALLNDDIDTESTVLANLNASYEIIDGLTYKINLGLDSSNDHFFEFRPSFFFSNTGDGNINTDADLVENRIESKTTLIENTLNYTKTFGNHKIDALIGNTRQETKIRGLRVFGTNFSSNGLNTPTGAIEKSTFDGDQITSGLLSYFGRLNYSFKDKYLLSGSLRSDGSSRFSSSNRYADFYSVSGGWRISEENFFNSDFITELKLRVGFGTIGAQNVADYQTSSAISTQSQYHLGGSLASGAAQLTFSNPNLIWETSETTNIGLDFEILKGKFIGSFEYFKKDSNDVLAQIPIPSAAGSSQPLTANAASISNKGFETSLTYRKSKGDFTFDITGNLSIVDNKVTSLGQGGVPIIEQANITTVGHPLASFYGLVHDGIFQSQAEIDAYTSSNGTVIQPDAKVGDLRFIDQNDDGSITFSEDRVITGSPFADFEFGLNFSGKYKQFDFSLFLQGTVGNEVFNGDLSRYYLRGREYTYVRDYVNNSSFPRLDFTNTDQTANTQNSTWFLEDASYARLKSLQIGYTMPESILDKVGFKSARIYWNVQNLFTITKFTGLNPVVGNKPDELSGRPTLEFFERGVISNDFNDPSLQPYPRTFSIGIDVTF